MDIDEAAREFAQQHAGNWLRWSSCVMDSPGEFEEDWFFFEPEHRDSGPLDRANTQVFKRELESHTHGDDPDTVFTSVGCWAYGWRTQIRVRMFTRDADGQRGDITAAAQVIADLHSSLEDYPVLDEELFSRLEYEEWERYVSDEISFQFRRGFTSELAENEVLERAFEHLRENWGYSDSEFPDSEEIREALRAVGCKEEEE